MVGRLLSFWGSLFSGAMMLVLGRISHSSHSSQRVGVFLEVSFSSDWGMSMLWLSFFICI